MKIQIKECQMIQGRQLIKYARVKSVEYTEEERNYLEAESFNEKATLWENTYFGEESINLADASLIDDCGRIVAKQYAEYIINEYSEELDVLSMSDDEIINSNTLQKIIIY